jgi:hypothetical protein
MDERAVMELALRVLTEITQNRKPAADDVDQLRKLVPTRSPDVPIDQIARDLIQKVLKEGGKVPGKE